MGEPRDEWIQAPGGPRLYARWRPAAEPRGTLVFVHGFGEHAGRYEHVLAAFDARGYGGLAFDRRGFGRSEGRRAFVRRFDEYLDDVDAALAAAAERSGDGPPWLVGHSAGGLVALLHALERPGRVAGLVVSAPALRFAVEAPAWKRALGRLASRVWPTLALPSGIEPELLTHDRAIAAATAADPLMALAPTARWYTEALDAQERVRARAGELTPPLLVLGAGADRICDPAAVREIHGLAGSPDKDLRWYDGLYHELFNELERERVFDDVAAWLDRRGG